MSSSPLTSRSLTSRDEPTLRAFWAREPEAHLFAIPDLDFCGWRDARLHFTGWFAGATLVAYWMHFGVSAQWGWEDARAVPEIAALLQEHHVAFVSGPERTTWPVLERLPRGTVARHEPSTVARLDPSHFIPTPGRARQATTADLDALTAVHVAAPDQFNHFDYRTRRHALRGALTDGWRRIFLAETPEGHVVAAAQSSAEGREMAVIGGVVTHPAFRGQGHATAATGALCAALLREHKTPYLFYRRDNAPAARVYEKLGFIPLGDSVLAELCW